MCDCVCTCARGRASAFKSWCEVVFCICPVSFCEFVGLRVFVLYVHLNDNVQYVYIILYIFVQMYIWGQPRVQNMNCIVTSFSFDRIAFGTPLDPL